MVLLKMISLTPPMGFIVQSDAITVNDEKINVLIKPLGFRTGITQKWKNL